MRSVERAGNLDGNRQDVGERERIAFESFRERLALKIVHDKERRVVVFADVVERVDVWVRQLRDRARFTIKAIRKLRIHCKGFREDLDRDDTIEADVARFVHFTTPPAPTALTIYGPGRLPVERFMA